MVKALIKHDKLERTKIHFRTDVFRIVPTFGLTGLQFLEVVSLGQRNWVVRGWIIPCFMRRLLVGMYQLVRMRRLELLAADLLDYEVAVSDQEVVYL